MAAYTSPPPKFTEVRIGTKQVPVDDRIEAAHEARMRLLMAYEECQRDVRDRNETSRHYQAHIDGIAESLDRMEKLHLLLCEEIGHTSKYAQRTWKDELRLRPPRSRIW